MFCLIRHWLFVFRFVEIDSLQEEDQGSVLIVDICSYVVVVHIYQQLCLQFSQSCIHNRYHLIIDTYC